MTLMFGNRDVSQNETPPLGAPQQPQQRRRQGTQPLGGGQPLLGATLGQTGTNAQGIPWNELAGGGGMSNGGGFGRGNTATSGNGMTPFTATNNLIGTQINPTNSRATNQAQGWTSQSGSQYNNYQLKPFQGIQPLSFGTETGMLNDAQKQMQGTSYDFSGANGAYGQAQSQQKAAAAGAGGYAAQAAQLAQAGTSGGGGYSQAADTGRARELAMKGLEGLQGPDRVALAGDALKIMEERSQPGYEQSLRSVNQKSAAMGRRGSGVTTNELGDVTLARERELALARRDAANQAAGQTLDDRLNVVNASQGVAQGFGSLDQSGASINDAATRAGSANSLQAAGLMRGLGNDAYGMGMDGANMSMSVGDRYGDQARDRTGLSERQSSFTRGIANDRAGLTRDVYGAARDERDTSRDDEFRTGDFLGNRFDRNAGYLNQNQGQDRANRNEMRDERDYQYGLDRDSIDDGYRQQGWEEQLRNNRYTRGLGTANLGFGAESPAGAYGAASDRYGQQSADGYGLVGAGLEFAGNAGTRRRRSGAGSGGN